VSEPTHITVRNAHMHNLQGVDVAVPRHALVVFTGVSGSGKSSLVFDTIHQEGQRRFVESLSSYARQFLGSMERPEVDSVEGVSPAVSIDQKTAPRNPRSTVGTVTEILDHLRLLFARLGQPRCPICSTPIETLGVGALVDDILAHSAGQKLQVLAPVVRERKGTYQAVFERLHRDGWIRGRVDGAWVRFDEPPTLERYVKHTIEVVVDRLKVKDGVAPRLQEALETAMGLAEDVVTVVDEEGERTFSTARACPNHPDQSVPELEPRLFSFNAPQGACPACDGLGVQSSFDPGKIFDMSKPVAQGILVLNADGRIPFGNVDVSALQQVAQALGQPVGRPLVRWDEDAFDGMDVRPAFGIPRWRRGSDDRTVVGTP